MEIFSFVHLHTVLSPNFSLGRSHQMFLQLCVVVVVLEECLFNTQSHLTLMALHENFSVTPLDLPTRHLSCVSDRVGQCLLPQTSSLETCGSTLGGLCNGVGTLHSCPACANIFLKKVNWKSSNIYVTTLQSYTVQTMYNTSCQVFPWRYVCLWQTKLILKCTLLRGPHDWNTRPTESLEEAICKSSVCKETLCYFLTVVLQLNWGLGWLFVEVPRSHTHTLTHAHLVGILRTGDQYVAEATNYTTHNRPKTVILCAYWYSNLWSHEWNLSMVHQLTSWRSILILHSQLCLGLPSGLFPSGFSTKTLYTPFLSLYMLHAQPISFFATWSPK